MAANYESRDRETFLKLCEVLEVDPQGILALDIHCNVKDFTTYEITYLHQARVDKKPAPTTEPDESWRDKPPLA